MVSAYVEEDLDVIDDAHLQAHLDRVDEIFRKLTYKTNGVLTYYYRIDPTISNNVKGFWYVQSENDEFVPHEVTDITLYDTSDTSKLIWFTVPKAEGKSIWLPPYITDNLDVRVISYNVPVYYENTFVGVIGIEIDYTTMAEQVDNIQLFQNGYAFINDEEGKIIYHPKMDVTTMEVQPSVPKGLLSKDIFINYTYEGVAKKAVWLPLRNGMRLNVTVPTNEINAMWVRWVIEMLIVFIILLVFFVFATIQLSGHITRPLRDLTEAAKQVDIGNYDFDVNYSGKDEVGTLTRTFKKLTEHLKLHIDDLNDKAYKDALTSLYNKAAYDKCISDIQAQMNEEPTGYEFAVCIFDCNDLKKINDNNGHDKGNLYLKEVADTLVQVYQNSSVFRIGGDEFAAILIDKDYEDRDDLLELFDNLCKEKRRTSADIWEKINVARGMAIFDPNEDSSVSDVVRRADRYMYENKWIVKNKEASNKDE